MGKLKIEGTAKKECEYDLMEITVRFQVHENSSSKAISKMITQCEECLSILNQQGIDLNKIRIGEDKVEQRYFEDGLYVTATREIILRLPFDIKTSNYFMELIQKKEYDVDLETIPLLSNEDEIYNNLLKLAIKDSKCKASFVADAMKQKIIGIDSVKIEDRYSNSKMEWIMEQERGIVFSDDFQYSNQLNAPTTTKSASVQVVWIIE